MHKIVIDFDFTILGPLLIFLLISLWNSIQAHRGPSEYLWENQPLFEETEKHSAWERECQEEKRKARGSIWISAITLVLFCGLCMMGDTWKLNVAFEMWHGLQFISVLAFVFATLCAWHYARTQKRWKLILCLLAMFLTAASAEHFFHQTDNAGRIVCPHCDVDDQPDDQ